MTLYLPPNQNEIVSYVSKFSLSCIWIATPGTADQPCMIGGAVDLAAALRAISRKIELRQQSSANARRMVGRVGFRCLSSGGGMPGQLGLDRVFGSD